MDPSSVPRRRGPIDVELWPSALTARVVQPGAAPRVHGYDVQTDLARHYSFAELALLSWTGVAPDRKQGRAFEIALAFLAPVAVNEAPGHAAVVAQLIGADASGVIAGAAMGLCERARYLVAEQAELLAWLGNPVGELPEAARSSGPEDDAAVARLEEALRDTGVGAPVFAQRPTLVAALLGVLHGVGLAEAARLEAAFTLAALPATLAEAFAAKPFAFFTYPMDLPAFRYVEDEIG